MNDISAVMLQDLQLAVFNVSHVVICHGVNGQPQAGA